VVVPHACSRADEHGHWGNNRGRGCTYSSGNSVNVAVLPLLPWTATGGLGGGLDASF